MNELEQLMLEQEREKQQAMKIDRIIEDAQRTIEKYTLPPRMVAVLDSLRGKSLARTWDC